MGITWADLSAASHARLWEHFSGLKTAINAAFQRNGVGALAVRTSDQSIPSSTPTAIVLQSARHDTSGFLSGGGLVVPPGLDGVYVIAGGLQFAQGGSAAPQECYATVNGSTIAGQRSGGCVWWSGSFACVASLAAGDVIRLMAMQETGGTLYAVGTRATFLSVARLER